LEGAEVHPLTDSSEMPLVNSDPNPNPVLAARI